MRSNFRIIPYSMASQSARALAEGLGGLRVRSTSKTFRPRARHLLINWGWAGDLAFTPHDNTMFNHPEAVNVAGNKLLCFRALSDEDVRIPRWTANKEEAVAWGGSVVCRHALRGHSGQGIELVEAGQPLPDAPLYVEYIKKSAEFRVHVLPDGSVSVAQKRRCHSVPDDQVNWQIRSHNNGFIFARENIDPEVSRPCIHMAKRAVQKLGLAFGAVDVVYNGRSQYAYVLEVNTAPGLEGSTITEYIEAFERAAL